MIRLSDRFDIQPHSLNDRELAVLSQIADFLHIEGADQPQWLLNPIKLAKFLASYDTVKQSMPRILNLKGGDEI